MKKVNNSSGDAVVARSGIRRTTAPKFGKSTQGITITRSEFVGTLTNGSTVNTFKIDDLCASSPGYDLNPNCPQLFPWLSGVASSYERFQFQKVAFKFIPSQASTTAGRYYAAVDYDYNDELPSSKGELMSHKTACEAPIWEPCGMVCTAAELHRDTPFKYVLDPTRGAAVEPRTAYCGYLIVGFDTPTANCNVDIWVEYTVLLVDPSAKALDPISFMDSKTGDITYTAGVSPANGDSFFGIPKMLAGVVPTGPIKVVTPGYGSVPPMTVVLGTGSAPATAALDISMGNDYTGLSIAGYASLSAGSPKTLLDTNSHRMSIEVFNKDGQWLGNWILASNPSNITSLSGIAEGSTWAQYETNGRIIKHVLNFFLRDLRSTYRLARYLVPIFTSTLACGAGYVGWGYKTSGLK